MKLFLILFNLLFLFSQQIVVDRFEYLVETENLIINEFAEDDNGVIWMASEKGLLRFDGLRFVPIRSQNDSLNVIQQNINNVTIINNEIYFVKNNKLYLIDKYHDNYFLLFEANSKINDFVLYNSENYLLNTDDGIQYFNSRTQIQFKLANTVSIKFGKLLSHSNHRIYTIAENGIYQIEIQDNLQIKQVVSDEIDYNLLSLVEDVSGDLWFLSANKALIYSLKTNNIIQTNKNKYFNFISNKLIKKIISDKKNRLLFITFNSGLIRFDFSERAVAEIQNIQNEVNSIISNNVSNLYIDQNNNYWVSFEDASFNKIKEITQSQFNYMSRSFENLGSINFYSLNEVYYKQNKSIYKTDLLKNNVSLVYTGSSDNTEILNQTIIEITSEKIKLSSAKNLQLNLIIKYSSNDKIFYQESNYHLIFIIQRKVMIINTLTMKIEEEFQFSKKDEKIIHQINTVYNDKNNLWVAGPFGLSKFNKQNESLVEILIFKDAEANQQISKIKSDINGNLWMASKNEIYISRDKETLEKFELPERFYYLRIQNFLNDAQGNLWLLTHNSLIYIDLMLNLYRELDKKEAVFIKDPISDSFIFTNNYIYVLQKSRLLYFKPDEIYFVNKKSNIAIHEITYKNKIQHLFSANSMASIETDYQDPNLRFVVSSIESQRPEKSDVYYRLLPVDSQFIFLTQNQDIVLSNLQIGKYLLEIKSKNSDDVWSSETKQIEIVIPEPLWMNLWIRIAFVLALLGILLLYYKTRTQFLKKQKQKLEEMVEERSKEIKIKSDEILKINDSLIHENNIRKEIEDDLKSARAETDLILNNVQIGIFLLDSQFKINEQHSNELEKIFSRESIAGYNLLHLLKPLVQERVYQGILDYLTMMLNPDIEEDVLQELNPLEEIQLSFIKDAGLENKYLGFKFNRIFKDRQIIQLLGMVTDITNSVMLKHELEETKKRNKSEFENLINILQCNPKILNEFIQSSLKKLKELRAKIENFKGNYEDLLQSIYGEVHKLKGGAGLINSEYLVKSFHDIENKIQSIKNKFEIKGEDFLSLLFYLEEIERKIVEINHVYKKIKSFINEPNYKPESQSEILDQSMNKYIETNYKNSGKSAIFKVINETELKLKSTFFNELELVLVQLVNNSMEHGIEESAIRLGKGKKPEGQLFFKIKEENNVLRFSYQDDGKGLDINHIVERAIAKGIIRDTSVKLTQSDVIKILFVDGFSENVKLNHKSGRGLGMGLVKKFVKDFSGQLKVSFAKDKYFHIHIDFSVETLNQIVEKTYEITHRR